MNTTTLVKNEQAGELRDTVGLNYFEEDVNLHSILKQYMSEKDYERAKAVLSELGEIAGDELDQLSRISEKNPPELVQYNAKGDRIDHVDYHPSYKKMEELGYGKFGMVAMSHRKDVLGWPGDFPSVLKYATWYLFAQSEFSLLCPMSMTDAAARVIDKYADDELKAKYLPRLTSTDMDELWTGAQFMTEVQGGSDVAQNSMVAKQVGDHWELTGDKWFCSNASADVALALARPENSEQPGTRGLGLFLIPKYLEDGTRNHYKINRLKDKFGTKNMASGEITFEGTIAYQVGELDRGFKQMMSMVSTARLSNSVRSAGLMRRSYLEALEYAKGRIAFGKKLSELPLMMETLFELLLDSESATSSVLHTAKIFSEAEAGSARGEALMRVLTPMLKGYICKRARYSTTEAMEARGGNGFIEDWVNGKLVREATLGSIWEGTTNILALDILRAFTRDKVGDDFFSDVESRLVATDDPSSKRIAKLLNSIHTKIQKQTEQVLNLEGQARELPAKQLMNKLYHLYAVSLLFEQANIEINEKGSYRKLYLTAQYTHRYFLSNGLDGVMVSNQSLLDVFEAVVNWERVPADAVEKFMDEVEALAI